MLTCECWASLPICGEHVSILKTKHNCFFCPGPSNISSPPQPLCIYDSFSVKSRISVPVHTVDVGVFYMTSENFDLLVALEGTSTDQQGHQSWLSGHHECEQYISSYCWDIWVWTPVVDWLLTNSSHVSFGFFSYIWLPVTYWTFVCSLLLLEENTRSTSIRVFLCDLFISCLHFNTQRRQPNTNTLWLLAAPNTTTFFSTETRLFRLRDAFSVVITQLGNKQCLPWQ